ncbi:MAG: VWA domain-containing protein [Oleiphilus sp.]
MPFLLKLAQIMTPIQRLKLNPARLGIIFFATLFSTSLLSETIISDHKQADIRLLIDISGSMKKNDPANLRVPSVSLLTELIPDGDKAGVWTFGQWVNNLVKHKTVDDAWRADAKEQAKKINSVALFTNIGAVLEKASDDFYKTDADFTNTHFILLTDGMIDIDRDASKNDIERERVLTSVLDTFKQKGAKIHAISLSNNADLSLMDKLAIQTGGQSAVAETSEDLTKIFVQALDQAVPSEQVPIEGNEFAIDSSIEEFTALIFRGENGVPTEIISPDETVYQYGKKDPDVKWFQDAGYDLITITRPLEGTWRIKSDIQPESRVTVVSNLQLDVSKLPANFFAGEQLDVNVSFIEENKRVTNPEFLSLLDVELQLTTEEGKSASKSMSDSSTPPEDGVFRESITKLSKVGQYEVNVLVDGKTFKRSKRQIVNLRAPFDFEFSVKSDVAIPYYELVVTPLNDSIKIDETSIFVKTKFPDNSSLISALEMDESNSRWVLEITPDKGDGIYEVAVKVKSLTNAGKEFQFKPKPFEAEFPIPVGAANKIVSVNEEEEVEEPVEPVVEEAPKEVTPEEPVPEPEPAPEEPVVEEEPVEENTEDSGFFWWLVGGAIAAGTLLIGGITWFVLKKRRENNEDEPGEILTDEDLESLDESASEDVPVVEDAAFDEPEELEAAPLVEEEPEPAIVEMEEPEEEPEPEVEMEDLDLNEDLDFTEAPADLDPVEEPPADADPEEALDLSPEDITEAIEELEPDILEQPDIEEEPEEETDLADIAQAIEESAEEPDEALDEEIEKALDINDDDDDDDDEEFNLEDFDIGDTDDLPDPEDKP